MLVRILQQLTVRRHRFACLGGNPCSLLLRVDGVLVADGALLLLCLLVIGLGLLVCMGRKHDAVTESNVESSWDNGKKKFEVVSLWLLRVKLSTFILSHLQQCQTTLEQPRYDIFLDDICTQDL